MRRDTVLEGKKLLVLGGSASELPLVLRARDMGIFVVCTDSNTNYDLSPAKRIANEAWDISWSDIEELENACREAGVDGVIAGYSEFRVEYLIKLCDRLHFPCYITREQLDLTRDKALFKRECEKCGIPTIPEYESPEMVETFPVIVKPVDRGGSIGISVARNADELARAYEYALNCSPSKKVIIEDFIADQVKVDSYYCVTDGEVQYLGMSDTLTSPRNGEERVIQDGWVLPSIFEREYIKRVDPAARLMIEDMGIENGFIFFSGFAGGKGRFAFFETGFRLSGGELFLFFEKQGQQSVFDQMIEYALTGVGARRYHKDARCLGSDAKCAVVNYYLTEGEIAEIVGFDEVEALASCTLAISYCYKGQHCESTAAILPKAAMFHFCACSFREVLDDIRKANDMFKVRDTTGKSLVYSYANFAIMPQFGNVIRENYDSHHDCYFAGGAL